jgi:hypothetical protein
MVGTMSRAARRKEPPTGHRTHADTRRAPTLKEEPMFWNDPHLYGATLPYKEIPTPYQTPFMGSGYPQWQNLPRFVPPIYGFNPYFRMPQVPFPTFNTPIGFKPFDPNVPRYDLPQVPYQPFFNQMAFKPWERNIPQYDLPQVPHQPFFNQMAFKPWEMNIPQYDLPQVPHQPFFNQMAFKPWEMNIPQYDFFRPFTY